jgi:hypothetical protein
MTTVCLPYGAPRTGASDSLSLEGGRALSIGRVGLTYNVLECGGFET